MNLYQGEPTFLFIGTITLIMTSRDLSGGIIWWSLPSIGPCQFPSSLMSKERILLRCLSTTWQQLPSCHFPGPVISPGSCYCYLSFLSLLIQIHMFNLVTQVWIPRAPDPRLRWHLPGACQDASLRQAQHTLRHRIRAVFVYLDRDKIGSLSNLDILQVCQISHFQPDTQLVSFSSTVEAPQIVEMFPAYYIFNGLFSILLVLHVIWTYFIYKVAYRSLTKSVSKFFYHFYLFSEPIHT